MPEALPQVAIESLQNLRLDRLCTSARFYALDRREAYYRCRQYDHLAHDWDGYMHGFGEEIPVMPGYHIPLNRRRPRARFDLAKIIVSRFTALLMGEERFPEILVEGDPDAQDYTQTLARVSKLQSKMIEARNLGGAEGTGVLSFGFVKGKPRVAVHNPKHCTPLRWEDRDELRLASMLEAYSYPEIIWDAGGKPKTVTRFYAHYWDQEQEIVWDPISEEQAKQQDWSTVVQSYAVQHGWGFCPVYWIQNKPDSGSVDGESDFEGQEPNLDDINILLSATSKGGVANVDPTLVIKDDPEENQGTVRKGSGEAIYSKGGAMYLELTGTAIKAALELKADLKQNTLDATSTVLPDPAALMGKAQSAAALRLYFAPMLTEADLKRTQWGGGIVDILTGMLLASRMVAGRAENPEVLRTADGRLIQPKPTLVLPQRILKEMEEVETGETNPVDGKPIKEKRAKISMVDRVPGTSENITLNWPAYFANSWQDSKAAVDAVHVAAGAKPIIQRLTAIRATAHIFGVEDPEAELVAIEEDEDAAAALAAQMGPQLDLNSGRPDEQTGAHPSEPPDPPGAGAED